MLVPADRLQALLPQRSIAENIAAPRFNNPRRWGPVAIRAERRRVAGAIEALSIDTRAHRQVRRLSGGNQQKVTIARWLANGFETLLCFDPTRGIDVGTKRQIYALLRSLAGDGAAILLFTSELAEIPLVCDRVDLPLRRAGHRRDRRAERGRGDTPAGDARPRARVGERRVSAVEADAGRPARRPISWSRLARRHAWTAGVYVLLVALFIYWSTIPANWGQFDVQSLVIDAMPFAFAAMAQAVVIISGGIDLSIGSMMSLINVLSAKYWLADAATGEPVSFQRGIVIALVLIAGAALAGALTGLIIQVTRVADIIVTLAMLFVWAGAALAVLEIPGGAVPAEITKLGVGYTGTAWLPTGIVIIAIVILVWIPIRWTKPGLSIYAIGSSRNASFLSGISVAKTRVGAYALGSALAAMGGLALTATSGIGDALSGQYYTLNSVAAVVLGGVSLVGGVGGLVGPVAAAFVLTLVKTILVLKGVDQNWAQVIQGTLIVIVVMIGGLALRSRGKRA